MRALFALQSLALCALCSAQGVLAPWDDRIDGPTVARHFDYAGVEKGPVYGVGTWSTRSLTLHVMDGRALLSTDASKTLQLAETPAPAPCAAGACNTLLHPRPHCLCVAVRKSAAAPLATLRLSADQRTLDAIAGDIAVVRAVAGGGWRALGTWESAVPRAAQDRDAPQALERVWGSAHAYSRNAPRIRLSPAAAPSKGEAFFLHDYCVGLVGALRGGGGGGVLESALAGLGLHAFEPGDGGAGSALPPGDARIAVARAVAEAELPLAPPAGGARALTRADAMRFLDALDSSARTPASLMAALAAAFLDAGAPAPLHLSAQLRQSAPKLYTAAAGVNRAVLAELNKVVVEAGVLSAPLYIATRITAVDVGGTCGAFP